MLSRPMLAVMNEIAADIDVPADHVSAGRTFANALGGPDRDRPDLPQISIHSGAEAPGDAFAAVRYRDAWYWISDGDFRSKRGLTSLLLFFSLADTGVVPGAGAPTLTIGVGN